MEIEGICNPNPNPQVDELSLDASDIAVLALMMASYGICVLESSSCLSPS